MSNKLSIVCDVAADFDMTNGRGEYVRDYDEASHVSKVKAAAAKHGVESRLADPGLAETLLHPVYEFTGTRAQLEAFVVDFFGAGQPHSDDVESYFEHAEEIG